MRNQLTITCSIHLRSKINFKIKQRAYMQQINLKVNNLQNVKQKKKEEKWTLSTRSPLERGTSSIPQPGGNLNLDDKGLYGVMAAVVVVEGGATIS